jgi:erythromycin esterase-like protein
MASERRGGCGVRGVVPKQFETIQNNSKQFKTIQNNSNQFETIRNKRAPLRRARRRRCTHPE